MQKWLFFFSFCLRLFLATSIKTLVLLDDIQDSDHYDLFFNHLKGRGHQLDIHGATEKQIPFLTYGEFQYDNIIFFCPNTKNIPILKDVLEFVEQGGNVLLASGTKLSKAQRKFAAECGVEYQKIGSMAMDHFYAVKDSEDLFHATIYADGFLQNRLIVGEQLATASSPKPVIFEGIGQTIDPDNVLAFSALTGSDTVYGANPFKDTSILYGKDLSLVSGVQARNNARMIFAGSIELFASKYFTKKTSNEIFTNAISKWVFGESGILRVSNIHHQRSDGSQPEKMLKDIERPDQSVSLYPDAEIARDTLVYRIKDNLTYSFDVMEWKDKQWIPFQADDMQLEFVMLDPYVRKNITHDNKGHFAVTFTSPDQYGIYQFRVMYRRLGYSTIHLTTQVSLRPYKHDEYERFILSAYPYYVSAFSMMGGVFLFSLVFLFSDN